MTNVFLLVTRYAFRGLVTPLGSDTPIWSFDGILGLWRIRQEFHGLFDAAGRALWLASW